MKHKINVTKKDIENGKPAHPHACPISQSLKRILKAKKNHGKVEGKSCVSWKINDYDIDKSDLVIDGEYEEVTERITDES